MKTKLSAALMLLLTSIVWGFAFVAQVKGSNHVDTFTFNGARFILGGLSLLPVTIIFSLAERSRKRKNLIAASEAISEASPAMSGKGRAKKTVIASLVCGVILFIASALQQYGAQITQSAGRSGFITGSYTVWVPVFYWLIFKKKVSLNTWVGMAVAMSGLALLCLKGDETQAISFGEVLLFVGVFFWAAHILAIDYFVCDINPLIFSMSQFLVCGIINAILAIIFEAPTLEALGQAKWFILYCGLLSVGVGYTFQILGQKHCDPTFAAIIFSTESVFSALGGAIFGVDHLSVTGYIGCAIVFVGIVIAQLDFSKIFRHKVQKV